MPRQYMSSDEPREYMGDSANDIYSVLTGGAKSRRPQVVKQPTTISLVPREFRPIIDKVAPREFRPNIDKGAPEVYYDSYEPIQPAYVYPDPQNDYIDVIIPGGTHRVYRGRGAGRRRKHRSPSSSSDEDMEGGGAVTSLFNIGKAIASTATKVVPRATTTVTRGATTATKAATTAAADAAAAAAKASAAAAAAAAAKPITLGTRLMNTASGLGNFGILAANIAAPIYMSVDQAQNTQRMIEAQKRADAENARLTAQAEIDRLEGLKLQEEMKQATQAQWEAYDLATQILRGTYVVPTSGTTTTTPATPATPQEVLDLLNNITAVTNPPTMPPPPASVPVPPGSGNPNVPIAPAPPQPPSIAPTQPTVPPTTLPPSTPSAPSAPSAPSKPSSNQYRGRGRGRRGGVTHQSHNILQILKAYNR